MNHALQVKFDVIKLTYFTFLFLFSFRESVKTLFWDMFGYGDEDAANIVLQNACPAPNNTKVCYYNTTKHSLTEGTGYTLYGMYHIVAIIVLVNVLIALMSNTLSKVQVRYYILS